MTALLLALLLATLVVGYTMYAVSGRHLAKTASIAALAYAASVAWFSADEYLGWAKMMTADPSGDVVLIAVFIREKSLTVEGKIIALGYPCLVEECVPTVADRIVMLPARERDEPRLFEFPYTEENRAKFAEARENIERGGRSVLKGKESKDRRGAGEHGDEGDGGQTPKSTPSQGDWQSDSFSAFAPVVENTAPEDLFEK